MIARAASMAVEDLEPRRLMSAGQLDATYGDGGIAHTDFVGPVSAAATRLVATSFGLLAIGTESTNRILLAEYDVNGAPISAFGQGGQVVFRGSQLGGSGALISAGLNTATQQSDGKLVLAGSVNGELAVVRLNTNGSLDTSFDGDGVAVLPLPGSAAGDVAMAGDKIVVSGTVNGDAVVARFTSTGALDASFQGGYVVNDFGGDDNVRGLAVGPDGSVVIAGSEFSAGSSTLVVVKYTSAGVLDTGFDVDGRYDLTSGPGSAVGVAVATDGSITVVGDSGAANSSSVVVLQWDGSNAGPLASVAGFGSDSHVRSFAMDSQGRPIVWATVQNGLNPANYILARFTTTGAWDFTYGGVAPTAVAANEAYTMALGAGDTPYILGDNAGDGPTHTSLLLGRFNSTTGARDLGFGVDNGFQTKDITGSMPQQTLAMGKQSDGGVILASIKDTNDPDVVVLTRYNPGGTLDTSFGSGGEVSLDWFEPILTLAVGPDNRIYVAGGSSVMAYSGNGALDTSFGTGGTFGYGDGTITAVTATADSVYIASLVGVDSGNSFGLAKLDAVTGAQDMAFGGTGTASAEFPISAGHVEIAQPSAVVVDGNGSVVVVGTLNDGTAQTSDFAVARFAGGALDSTFSGDGMATAGLTTAGAAAAAVDANGNVVVAGTVDGDQITVARFTDAGGLDLSFSGDGLATFTTADSAEARGVAVDATGNVVVSGTVSGVGSQFLVARLTSAGAADGSFGAAGIVTTSIGFNADAVGVAIDADGKILVGGTGDDDLAVARYDAADATAPLDVSLGDNFSINEGAQVTLTAASTGGSGSYTYSWDLDNDGQFDDATGAVVITVFDSGLRTVRVQVSDGATSATSSVDIDVQNLAPTAASISGPTTLVSNVAGTFTLGATDPSPADQTSNFTFKIDWDGDGSVDQTVVGPVGTTVSHAFTALTPTTFNVRVTATDKDGAESPVATTPVLVALPPPPPPPAFLTTDPLNPGKQMLVVNGGTGADVLSLSPGANGAINVIVNGVAVGTFSPTGRIVINGGDGNDVISVPNNVSRDVEIYGGAGNDVISAGSGGDIIVGGMGDDVLSGNNGNDLLIGGVGADVITGNNAEDILIAGTTAYDADSAALNAVLAEWKSPRSYADRIANLRGTQTNAATFAARLNGSVFLRSDVSDATVFDDGAVDVLSGGNGSDWFLFNNDAGVKDIIDAKSSETSTDINP